MDSLGEDWQVAIEADRPDSSVLVLVKGDSLATCQTWPNAGHTDFENTAAGIGKHPTRSPAVLSYLTGARSGNLAPYFVGRVPPSASTVRLSFLDGSQQEAVLGGGLWLAWPEEADVGTPTLIEATDPSGQTISQLADPEGIQPTDATTAPVPTSSSTAAPVGARATPSPSDVTAAISIADRYTRDLVQGNFAAAFAALGPTAQQHWGSLAAFTYDRKAFFMSVQGQYRVRVPLPAEEGPITDWLPATYGAAIDLAHAVLVEVDYPRLAGNNAGFDLYIVAPTSDGLVLYDVR